MYDVDCGILGPKLSVVSTTVLIRDNKMSLEGSTGDIILKR